MRYATYSATGRDSQVQSDGDQGFIGLDLKSDPPVVQPGFLNRGENTRLRTGVAKMRDGTDVPAYFNPDWFGARFVGSGIYSSPNDTVVVPPKTFVDRGELMLIAEYGKTYVTALKWGAAPQQIPITYNDGKEHPFTNDPVSFVQAFDKVVMLQSPRNKPLVWDGLAGGFIEFAPPVPGDPAVNIPNSFFGEPFDARVLYYGSSDTFYMSEPLEYGLYDPALGAIRINAGKNDKLVRIFGFNPPQSIVIFGRRTIYLYSNFAVDPSLAVLQQINGEYGIAANRCAVQVGADVYFLSNPGGIFRVSQFLQQLSTKPEALSDPIRPIIERINWNAILNASAASLAEYVYFAVPLDDSQYPNAILVGNTTTGNWESAPDSRLDPNCFITNLLVSNYANSRRLFGVDGNSHRVYLLDEGTIDRTCNNPVVENPIPYVIQTRGYGGSDPILVDSMKSFRSLGVSVRTVAPSITLTSIVDGYNEEKNLTPTPITKSNTKFYPWGSRPYNYGTDDPTQPKREDYSPVYPGEFTGQDFESLALGRVDTLPAVNDLSEPSAGVMQTSLERRNLKQIGRWASIRVECNQGRCDVLSMKLDMLQKRNNVRVAA